MLIIRRHRTLAGGAAEAEVSDECLPRYRAIPQSRERGHVAFGPGVVCIERSGLDHFPGVGRGSPQEAARLRAWGWIDAHKRAVSYLDRHVLQKTPVKPNVRCGPRGRPD
jgi:hypothetical protein